MNFYSESGRVLAGAGLSGRVYAKRSDSQAVG